MACLRGAFGNFPQNLNRMRNLLFGLALITSFSLQAQRKLKPPPVSFHFDAGYGLGLPAQQTLERAGAINQSFAIRSAGGLQVSFGAGIGVGRGFRLILNAHYQRSATFEYEQFNLLGDLTDNTFRYQTLSLSPLFHYRVLNQSDKWTPYISFGPSVYVYGDNQSSSSYFDSNLNFEYDVYSTLSYGISFGGRFSIGFERKLGEKLFLTAAVQFRAAYLGRSLNEVTRVIEDGTDITDQFTVAQLQTEYVKGNYTSATQRPSEATKSPYRTEGYLGYDLTFGLAYYLFD